MFQVSSPTLVGLSIPQRVPGACLMFAGTRLCQSLWQQPLMCTPVDMCRGHKSHLQNGTRAAHICWVMRQAPIACPQVSPRRPSTAALCTTDTEPSPHSPASSVDHRPAPAPGLPSTSQPEQQLGIAAYSLLDPCCCPPAICTALLPASCDAGLGSCMHFGQRLAYLSATLWFQPCQRHTSPTHRRDAPPEHRRGLHCSP